MDAEVCRAPDCRPTGAPADSEVAAGGSLGGRDVVEDGGGDAARGGDFAVAGEYVPALRLRPLGPAVATQTATGDVIVVRYADDIVMGFEHRADAERCLEAWQERLRQFGLALHPDKTRLIEFGRYAAERRKRRGEGKPETFDFLGFTHICGTTRKTGRFIVKRQTIRKRLSAKLQAVKAELRRRWHEPVPRSGGGCARWCRAGSTTTRCRATWIA